jgi:hypothetical protein
VAKLGHHRLLFRDPSFSGFELSQTLFNYQVQDCSDPRDMVYALFGLAHQYDDPEHTLNVDYYLEPGEVFETTTRYIIPDPEGSMF